MKYFAKTIVVEGPDKCGKQTQTEMLEKHFSNAGKKVKRIEVPINDFIFYKLIYSMLHSGTALKYPHFFQFVQFLNKILFQMFCLPYLMLTNDVIIFDRWSLSSFVYGLASGCNETFVDVMYSLMFKPDITFIFSGSSYVRTTTVDDSYEKNPALQRNVHELYMNFDNGHGDKIVHVNNENNKHAIHLILLIEMAMKGL